MTLLAVVAVFTAACSYTHLYGETIRGSRLARGQHCHVIQNPADKRGIDGMIAQRLRDAGFGVSSGSGGDPVPTNTDLIVVYEDHWHWDMGDYLLTLRIDFRDPETRELRATGQSYRTSLDRAPPAAMVDEIVTAILAREGRTT
jgi:hypothetical protein